MASSFIDTFQSIATSVSSSKNGFTWDNSIRTFQYGVAGITLAALSIFETTKTMQCSTPSPSFPEYYFASSYCAEATWYYITDSNTTRGVQPYDEFLRYFKWYILIPPVLTIMMAVLYGALVDSFVIQVCRSATQIMDIWNATTNKKDHGSASINADMLNMAIRARVFAETNMHYKKSRNLLIPCTRGSKKCSPTYGATDKGDHTELFRVDQSSLIEQRREEVKSFQKLGEQTALYFNLYLAVCLIINVCAVAFINPYYFWFPKAIACKYRKEDLTFHWSICSVPGHRYSRVAVLIVMLSHTVGALVAILSFIYLHIFIPRQFLSADIAVHSYTRNPKLQEKLIQCWNRYGRRKVTSFTSTTKFILALIYQNIDRCLCYRLILAMIDIDKDKDSIESELPRLIQEIVAIDAQHPGVHNEDKEERIDEIRETILNPCGIEEVKGIIQSNVLVRLVGAYLDNPNSISELFGAQQIQRLTGVQLPKLSREVKEKFSCLIQYKEESEFGSSVEYYRYLSALYDLSKDKQLLSLLQPMEIGRLSPDESRDNVTDNGHEAVGDQQFNAKKAFDTSGYCWRSSDATAYNWIKRTWDEEHTIQLIAIQGSHVNEKATPIRFNFTAKLQDSETGNESWEEISETYRSYDWLKDEWRIFSVVATDKLKGTVTHPRTKSLQINIFNNGGGEYFEIQKIKIYGCR